MKKALVPRSFSKVGFTLLELLVVIGIIGVLVAIGTVSYSTAQKKARDAKRKGDLSSFQKTMEQCYSVNSYKYPTTDTGLSVADGVITLTCPAPNNSIAIIITDPLNTGTYIYALSVTSSSAYTVTADLETSTTDATISQQQ